MFLVFALHSNTLSMCPNHFRAVYKMTKGNLSAPGSMKVLEQDNATPGAPPLQVLPAGATIMPHSLKFPSLSPHSS